MLHTDTTPQSDALALALSAACALPERALRAVQGARELETEVMLLRQVLAAMPAGAARDPAWREEVLKLLSKVVVFRVALAAPTHEV